MLCYPAFNKGLGAILSQEHTDGKLHPVAYTSRALSHTEKRYAITDLETLAIVWAVTHFHAYLYGHDVLVYTDHSAVRAVLETPSASGKHARWWSKLFSSGLRSIKIVYRPGKDNVSADALSRCPISAPHNNIVVDDPVQIAQLESSSPVITDLLNAEPFKLGISQTVDFASEQSKNPVVNDMIQFLTTGTLPDDVQRSRKVVAQAPSFTMIDNILYYLDSTKRDRKRCVVPLQLRQQVMEEYHSGPLSGHFSGDKLYKTLVNHWWWQGMYSDVLKHCSSCPQCAIVNPSGRVNKPPLQPIPVSRPFQILGVDIMDLPYMEAGNKHVIVFQDYLTKFPLVFPVPDQKTIRLSRLLVEDVISLFGVPEALLSDRGTNLLSHLMQDLWKMFGIKKLNTTAYHPQCDGMVERFNRTLKTILRKHTATYGNQWDWYLFSALYAYHNTPHKSTGEKPNFLLFGVDCRTPYGSCISPWKTY